MARFLNADLCERIRRHRLVPIPLILRNGLLCPDCKRFALWPLMMDDEAQQRWYECQWCGEEFMGCYDHMGVVYRLVRLP